jgi:hypothetical protein
MDGDQQPGQDDDVDQYFDDGGETFLPADHVNTNLPAVSYRVTLGFDGASAKRFDKAVD